MAGSNGNGQAAVGRERGILVVGGGMAGISAAIEAAEAGSDVYVVEQGPSLGGRVVPPLLHDRLDVCSESRGALDELLIALFGERLRDVDLLAGRHRPRLLNARRGMLGEDAEMLDREALGSGLHHVQDLLL